MNSIPLLQTAVNGIPFETDTQISNEEIYIMGNFVSHLVENDSDGFDNLVAFIKGYMLSNVLYFPKITDTQLKKNLRNVDFYFDTPFLINSFGITTEAYKKAYEELIEMLST